ncbi:tetratricopeptide repeat protein [Xenophilus arseniciresistens]|uniref:Tetratricopeptide repeat protein 38 n=1 Tax=Xenophilus arseniciresistens TaxID=1283306 RepID=A0AAE3N901_9BURK|nr:tetratricopeptide repeat protein [Xenophilus arseniciresistens]MDA7416803.1 tetratricopeptide repeat protein [Xenophilus arseniciresistens]
MNSVAPPTESRLPTDALGNPGTVTDALSRRLVDDFVLGFIACEARAANLAVQAHADEHPYVQACHAALQMFAESASAAASARPHIARAAAQAHLAHPREQRFIAAVAAWVNGDLRTAIGLHEAQAREYPRDLASLKLGQYHCFNLGDCAGMLRLALAAAPHAADVPQMHGMLAFGYEQCHLMRQAEASARQAIAMQRKEPWAHHALAHVMLTEGRLREGLAFMQDVSETWTDLNSFMLTHNWWHLALFLIDLGRADEALAVHDTHCWGVVRDYSQDQIGAVSLLARLELAGVDVGARWQALAPWLAPRTQDHVLPFLDLQYLYGLARAGRPEADTLLAHIEAHAPRAPEATRAAWQRVCVPAAHGLLAHARGRHAQAAQALGQALPRMIEIGGSHAQRDLFGQVWLDALVRSASPWALATAQDLLQQQANGQPESLRLRAQLRTVYAALGLPTALATAASGPA